MIDANFAIEADKTAGALAAVKALMVDPSAERGGGSFGGRETIRFFSWMNNARPDEWATVADALDAWAYPIDVDDSGAVVDIQFHGEKIGDEVQMFAAIAPFVTAGSYIAMSGEDGAIWRWYFDGRTCVEQAGQVSFPEPPAAAIDTTIVEAERLALEAGR